jgi:hypothetical protein
MPFDNGRWLDQDHSVHDLRPHPVKPDPEEPVRTEKPWASWTLASQDCHLVPKGDELKLQRSTATKPKREKGTQSRKNCDHGDDGRTAAHYSLGFLAITGF